MRAFWRFLALLGTSVQERYSYCTGDLSRITRCESYRCITVALTAGPPLGVSRPPLGFDDKGRIGRPLDRHYAPIRRNNTRGRGNMKSYILQLNIPLTISLFLYFTTFSPPVLSPRALRNSKTYFPIRNAKFIRD